MKTLIVALAAIAPITTQAKVILPDFFTDNMVIQRDAEITVPGTARKGATVTITPSWQGPIKAKANKAGKFVAKVPTPSEPGGPYTLTFDDGKDKVVLSNLLAGDVWFCSGQSNMEMPVEGWGRVMDYRREVEQANYPEVRLLQVKKKTSYSPQENAEVNMDGWREAEPQTVANFSAIGYFFGRDINQATGIPIGIIDCTWGGTPIESWSSYETLRGIDEYGQILDAYEQCGFSSAEAEKEYNQKMAEWNQLASVDEKEFTSGNDAKEWKPITVPGQWEKTVLPGFDGVVLMRRTVNVPAQVAGTAATLKLAMVDDIDVTYVNGQKVGSTRGYNVPRSYPIPAGLLKAGENEILVAVYDTSGSGGIWGEVSDLRIDVVGDDIPLDGVWEYSVIKDYSKLPSKPKSPYDPYAPTVLYNAMMHPIAASLPVKGILWYQGCANVGREKQYAKNFRAMINDWRREWNNPEMPFYFVQLAGYLQPKRFQPESKWAALRQAQASVLDLPNTGMAVTIDLGDPDDIHPKNKQEVAKRLARAALNNEYGIATPWQAPVPVNAVANGRGVVITFDGNVDLFGSAHAFSAMAPSGNWAKAYAKQLLPTQIEVISDDIDNPIKVRYNWADYPDGQMRAADSGLPVAPFSIDRK